MNAGRGTHQAGIAISEFKGEVPVLARRGKQDKNRFRILRRGKLVAEVVPPAPTRKRRKLGSMAGTVKIMEEIVSPIIDLK